MAICIATTAGHDFDGAVEPCHAKAFCRVGRGHQQRIEHDANATERKLPRSCGARSREARSPATLVDEQDWPSNAPQAARSVADVMEHHGNPVSKSWRCLRWLSRDVRRHLPFQFQPAERSAEFSHFRVGQPDRQVKSGPVRRWGKRQRTRQAGGDKVNAGLSAQGRGLAHDGVDSEERRERSFMRSGASFVRYSTQARESGVSLRCRRISTPLRRGIAAAQCEDQLLFGAIVEKSLEELGVRSPCWQPSGLASRRGRPRIVRLRCTGGGRPKRGELPPESGGTKSTVSGLTRGASTVPDSCCSTPAKKRP